MLCNQQQQRAYNRVKFHCLIANRHLAFYQLVLLIQFFDVLAKRLAGDWNAVAGPSLHGKEIIQK